MLQFVFFNSFTDHKLEFALHFKELGFKWTTDCSEQAYFLELHGLDIKGLTQVNTGALVSATHCQEVTLIQAPLFQLTGFGHAEKTSFSFLRKTASPLSLKSETQTSGQ